MHSKLNDKAILLIAILLPPSPSKVPSIYHTKFGNALTKVADSMKITL